MQSIKAAVCYDFGKPLSIENIYIDEPRKQEVKIKISACAICHSDILYMDGAWGGKLPTVFGHEAAGVVESCGPDVTSVNPGDAVIVSLLRSCGQCFYCNRKHFNLCEGNFETDEPNRLKSATGTALQRGLRTGGFAQYAVVHKSQVAKIPSSMNLSSASLLACGVITGFGSVENVASIENGDHVAVVGVGGVGINCVQAAKILGAKSIVAIDTNQDRLVVAKKFGATHTINPQESQLTESIRSITDNRGSDYVFVATGHPSATENALQLVRKGGALVLVGMPPDGTNMVFDTVEFIDANQNVLGSKMGNACLQSDIPKLVELYQSNSLELDELVTGVYRLEDINDAIAATRQGIGLRNVVVF